MWTISLLLAGLLGATSLHTESEAAIPMAPIAASADSEDDAALSTDGAAFFQPNAELTSYILDALAIHPGLRARHFEWRAAMQRIPQVKSLEDPMFSYQQILRSKDVTPEIMLRQAFPWFGSLRARGDKAAAEAEATLYAFYALRNSIVEEVKSAYFEFALLGKSVAVVESQLEVLRYISEIVEARLALGMAREDELLRLSIERTETQDQLDQFTLLRAGFQSRLNAAMGVRGNPERPWPAETQLPPDPPAYEALAERIAQQHPEVLAFAHRDAAARQEERLARLMGFPMITLGLQWTGMPDPEKVKVDRPAVQPLGMDDGMGSTALQAMPEPAMPSDDGDDEWVLSIEMSLPIWRKRVRAGIEEARLMRRAVAEEQRDTVRMLEGELGQAVYMLADAKRRYHLYSESLIPQAYQTFESLQNRYATSSEDMAFLDILESVRTMLSFQLAQLEAEKDWQMAAAMLERIVGGSLPDASAPPSLDAVTPAE